MPPVPTSIFTCALCVSDHVFPYFRCGLCLWPMLHSKNYRISAGKGCFSLNFSSPTFTTKATRKKHGGFFSSVHSALARAIELQLSP